MTKTVEAAPRPDYVMIVGQGRSGTNWLLDILDNSPCTRSRNEPNKLATSPLAKLPSPYVPSQDLSALADGWDEAIRWTSTHMGERDRLPTGPKDHVFRFSQISGLARIMNRRPRKLLSCVFPSLGKSEWAIPFWIASHQAIGRALPVVKFVQAPIWAAWVLKNRPMVQVLHIVRHPGGFLHSWRSRYLKSADAVQVRKANYDRLDIIRKAQPEWGERFGKIGEMSVEESELWYWRYASETIHVAGEGKPRYELIVYEELVADLLDVAKRVFKVCGLEWDGRIARCVNQSGSQSSSIAAAWRVKLSSEDLEIINRVFSGSLMESWWS